MSKPKETTTGTGTARRAPTGATGADTLTGGAAGQAAGAAESGAAKGATDTENTGAATQTSPAAAANAGGAVQQDTGAESGAGKADAKADTAKDSADTPKDLPAKPTWEALQQLDDDGLMNLAIAFSLDPPTDGSVKNKDDAVKWLAEKLDIKAPDAVVETTGMPDHAAVAARHEQLTEEEKVFVNVPRAFRLRLDANTVIKIRAGAQKLARSLAEHAYAKDNGVTIVADI